MLQYYANISLEELRNATKLSKTMVVVRSRFEPRIT